MWFFFFFSSRRRHTRFSRDWSSDVCSSDLSLAGLGLIGRTLEKRDACEDGGQDKRSNKECPARGEIADDNSCPAANGAEEIEREDGAALAQTKIRKAVSGVVLSGCCERQQSPSRTRNRHERGIENSHTQDQNRSKPSGQMIGILKAQFQSKRGHQETKKHGAAIAHEDLCGLEIPAQKSGCRAQHGGGQRSDQSLSVQVGKQREKNGSHRRDSGA